MLNTHSSVVITCSIPHSIQKLRRRFQYKKIFFRLVEHSLVKSCAEQYQLIFPIIIFQVNLKKKVQTKMKLFVVILATVACALAAPLDDSKNAQIVKYENDNVGLGGYSYA